MLQVAVIWRGQILGYRLLGRRGRVTRGRRSPPPRPRRGARTGSRGTAEPGFACGGETVSGESTGGGGSVAGLMESFYSPLGHRFRRRRKA